MTNYAYKLSVNQTNIALFRNGDLIGYIGDNRVFYPEEGEEYTSNDIAEIHNVQLNFLFIKRYLLENEKA